MGSEQSSAAAPKATRAPPVRRGHTIAAPSSAPEVRREPPASGNNSPGASVCSDSELPYISYTVDRPIGDMVNFKVIASHAPPRDEIAARGSSASVGVDASWPSQTHARLQYLGRGTATLAELLRAAISSRGGASDSPKTSTKNQRQDSLKSLLQRRQMVARKVANKRTRDIIVVKEQATATLDEDIRRLQEIPTFLPIMRGTLGLPGARDPEVLEGLDARPWIRLCSRLQAHLAACATPLAQEQVQLATKLKEADSEISRLYSSMVDKQRNNARHAERLARVHEVAHQLSRCNSLLQQTLSDVEELNALLPPDKRLEPFVWSAA